MLVSVRMVQGGMMGGEWLEVGGEWWCRDIWKTGGLCVFWGSNVVEVRC